MNGLSEQDIHNIKADYAIGFGVGYIADIRGFTSDQVVYGINLNEPEPIEFSLDDFNMRLIPKSEINERRVSAYKYLLP